MAGLGTEYCSVYAVKQISCVGIVFQHVDSLLPRRHKHRHCSIMWYLRVLWRQGEPSGAFKSADIRHKALSYPTTPPPIHSTSPSLIVDQWLLCCLHLEGKPHRERTTARSASHWSSRTLVGLLFQICTGTCVSQTPESQELLYI